MDSQLQENKTQQTGFTQVPNTILNSRDISWKAKALWAYMAGKPEGWKFTLRGIASQGKDGIKVVTTALKELMEIGLIKRKKIQTHEGKKCFYSIYGLDELLEHKNCELQNAILETSKMETSKMETSKTETSKTETSKTASLSNTNISNTNPSNNQPSNNQPSIVSNDTKPKRKVFVKPTVEEIKAYCLERNNQVDAERFFDYYEANGWKVGRNSMKDWKASVRTWERNSYSNGNVYQPNDSQALTERVEMTPEIEEMFDFWKQWVGIGCPRDNENVKACRDLLDDIKKGQLQRLIVGVALRGNTPGFVVGEITKIKDFVGLKQNAAIMQTFCNENWDYWNLVLKAASTGKNIWEVY